MSSATTHAPRTRTQAPPARVTVNRARLGRVALVLLVLLMASSYVRPALDWVSAKQAAGTQATRLAQLEATEARLLREKERLSTPRGLSAAARQLGMVREGERTYVVRGLPKH